LFEQQVKELTKHYRVVSLPQVRAHVLDRKSLPPRALLLTFDDGYRNVAHNALPVLKKMGLPSALFPVPGAIEARSWLWNSELEFARASTPNFTQLKRRLKALSVAERRKWLKDELNTKTELPECDYSLLNWEELSVELSKGNVEVGSHGLNHEPLNGCNPAELEMELSESRRLLRERLKVQADTLAYPNGDSAGAVVEAARNCGYRLGFTTIPRHVRSGDDPLTLPRILVGRSDTPPVLLARVAGWQEWLRAA
jgi:peptidoglycan/xylan/chitin deacetylase (PgdA/CDA1 family)